MHDITFKDIITLTLIKVKLIIVMICISYTYVDVVFFACFIETTDFVNKTGRIERSA